jgi:hypothetical protein
VSREHVLAHLNEQAGFCEHYGSRFTGELIRRLAADFESGGPTAHVVGDWPTNPRADVLALRLAGALHAAALEGRDTALAQLYPNARSEWRMDEVWPAARAFLARERDWVAAFIQSAPQTNEVRRSIALLAGFLAFAKDWSGPVDMLEIGASAGLNLNWDRFNYRTQSWSWGGESPVEIDTSWSGVAPPIEVRPNVRHRAACDLNPLDIDDPAQLLRLRSYIWPDQPERLARFDGAVALAQQAQVKVDRADAAEWLKQKLGVRARDAATIVYHSIFLQYPPREARAAIIDAIREAGEAATLEAPVAWVRLEPEALTDGVRDSVRMVADLTTWPGGERRVLAYTDGHVRAVHAV